MTLLTREQFREGCLARDSYECVICHATSDLSVHHIMERRLWSDGGYYLENGATLCEEHHKLAESTILTPQEIRDAAGVSKVLLPDSLYSGEYDKWGNLYLEDGRRMPGELFYDESVQKIIVGDFVKYVKYPRTPHLPFSPGFSDDDINWLSDEHMEGIEVVITEKMDGENTTMYDDFIHSRSLESGYHPSRTWVKNLHGNIAHDIPANFRVSGENLYAEHSIHYSNLDSYFMVFSIWDRETCLSWDETIEYANLLGLTTVPVFYKGAYHVEDIRSLSVDTERSEGFVVRPAASFSLQDFRRLVAKWVRPDHIKSDHHWIYKQVKNNDLK